MVSHATKLRYLVKGGGARRGPTLMGTVVFASFYKQYHPGCDTQELLSFPGTTAVFYAPEFFVVQEASCVYDIPRTARKE